MKKIGLLCASVVATLTLTTTVPLANVHFTETVVSAAQKDFSTKNYATMAYLKYTKQELNSVQDNTVEIEQEHGHFEIDNDNGEDFTVTVKNDHVTLTTTDQNGKKKSHTYSKTNLAKQFTNQQSKLNAVVEKDND